ncbi:hypothetical protein IFR05_016608 [Cadophora sp. M221]|nr:hypothetical protein IFR05_016608 [Cadophora sp. M221]
MDSLKPDPELDAVLVDKSPDGITTITLNRPRKRNAVNGATAKKLTQAFLAFESDPDQKVCVFHGANGTFCAGYDLQEFAESSTYDGPKTEDSITYHGPVDGRNIGPMGPSRMQIRKPVISAVSGYAVAGGLELSLLGDMRVVEEDAVFGVFCRRWGVPLIDGGTVRLQAVVGLGRALDMILTGRPVGAREALSFGLANRVVPKGRALEEAQGIARQLLAFPQGCMNLDRNSCYNAAYDAASFERALASEYDQGVQVLESESKGGALRFAGGHGRHGEFGPGKAKL